MLNGDESVKDVYFVLSDEFIDNFRRKQPKWGPVGYITYKRTYSRALPGGKSEEYWQTVRRVVEGCFTIQKRHCHINKLPWNQRKAQVSAQKMYQLMWDFKFTPPGRGLWMMGTEYIYKNGGAALNNCALCSTANIDIDFAEPFCFLMDMSMLGVGVGGDTKGAGKITFKKPKYNDSVFVVPDTREGWVDLLRLLLKGFSGEGELPKEIDYTQVRPLGAPILGFGGVASGPGPLKEMYDYIHDMLTQKIGQKISSTDIVDIFNLVGKCVVSGNVRRSAEIMFGEYADEDFLSLKDPSKNKDLLYHHRWSSNNSVFANIGMDYTKVAELTAKNGEPGYEWLENAQKYSRMNGIIDNKDYKVMGANPCMEQSLEAWELCNLVETYPSNHESVEEWIETLKYAYLYSKTITLIPTHNPLTNAVMLRNRRIGCSASGITQAFKKFGRRKFLQSCKTGYNKIQEWDKTYSDWLCIPRSIKTTSVKPSGTVSLLAGVTPGIHYPISQYYIRNIRFQEGSPLIEVLQEAGFKTEPDKYGTRATVVSFPVKEEYYDRSVQDVSMWEQLENASQIQEVWADNQVSVTISFSPEEAKDIKNALELYETRLKGVSFLPKKDHGYEQAPYIPITEEQYNELIKEVKPLKIKEDSHDQVDKFCDGDSCQI
jgi:adenosylcobalamin-dependent ribonucleoside-triphosphate reductase